MCFFPQAACSEVCRLLLRSLVVGAGTWGVCEAGSGTDEGGKGRWVGSAALWEWLFLQAAGKKIRALLGVMEVLGSRVHKAALCSGCGFASSVLHRLCSCWWLCPTAPFREADGGTKEQTRYECTGSLCLHSPRGQGLPGRDWKKSKYWPGCACLSRCCVLGVRVCFLMQMFVSSLSTQNRTLT